MLESLFGCVIDCANKLAEKVIEGQTGETDEKSEISTNGRHQVKPQLGVVAREASIKKAAHSPLREHILDGDLASLDVLVCASFLARASLHWHVQEHEAEEIVSSTCCPPSFAGQSRGEYILQNGKIGVTTFGESSGLFPVKQMLWWVVRKERADSSLC